MSVKIKNVKEELKKMSQQGLDEQISAARQELLKLRLSGAAGHVKNYSQYAKLRHIIACAETYKRQNRIDQ
jgi:ribosomal protein L29